LFKFKKDEDFNHRHTLSISRIELKLHFVQNVKPDTEIGQKGAFFKGFIMIAALYTTHPVPANAGVEKKAGLRIATPDDSK